MASDDGLSNGDEQAGQPALTRAADGRAVQAMAGWSCPGGSQ
ncbi:hypothetical protein RGUI_3809 [Rhodovulum sp. P5]|nr:hypothetical protein RGUI_3809 [Rhodovulum sp. P5]